MPKHNRIPYAKAQRKWEPQLSSAQLIKIVFHANNFHVAQCSVAQAQSIRRPWWRQRIYKTESTARCAPLPAGCCAKLLLMPHRAFTQRTKSFSGCLSEFPFSFQNVADDAKSSIASRKQQNIKKRKEEEETQILKKKKKTHSHTNLICVKFIKYSCRSSTLSGAY